MSEESMNSILKEEFDECKLEGRNAVLEALKSGRDINKIIISEGNKEGSIKRIISLAKNKKVVLQYVDKSTINKISSTKSHQGIIAYVSVKNYVDLDDILDDINKKGEKPFLLVLDGITDSHNFGAILRTANAVGVHGVIIPKRRSIGLNSIVAKSAAGAVEYVQVSKVVNVVRTLEYLKKKSIWIIGTDSDGREIFYKSDLKGPIALVIGSEGNGMSRLVKEKCDFTVSIPMVGKISSLNASVASAVVDAIQLL